MPCATSLSAIPQTLDAHSHITDAIYSQQLTASLSDTLRGGVDQTHSTASQLRGHVTELHQHDLVGRDGTGHLQVETGLELRKGKHWTELD